MGLHSKRLSCRGASVRTNTHTHGGNGVSGYSAGSRRKNRACPKSSHPTSPPCRAASQVQTSPLHLRLHASTPAAGKGRSLPRRGAVRAAADSPAHSLSILHDLFEYSTAHGTPRAAPRRHRDRALPRRPGRHAPLAHRLSREARRAAHGAAAHPPCAREASPSWLVEAPRSLRLRQGPDRARDRPRTRPHRPAPHPLQDRALRLAARGVASGGARLLGRRLSGLPPRNPPIPHSGRGAGDPQDGHVRGVAPCPHRQACAARPARGGRVRLAADVVPAGPRARLAAAAPRGPTSCGTSTRP